MPNLLIWGMLLTPIPLIGVSWHFHLAGTRRRMPRMIRLALIVISASYLLLLLELMHPELIGEHYGDLRANVILCNLALSLSVLLIGAISRSKVGLLVTLSSAVVGLDWLYMAAIGTAA